MSEDTSGQLAHHGRPFLTQLDHSQHVAPPLIGSAVCARVVFSSNDELVNQILGGGAVDHNISIKLIKDETFFYYCNFYFFR